MKNVSLFLSCFVVAFLALAPVSANAEMVSFFGIQGEKLPQWDVLTKDKTLIFKAKTQDAFIRVCKADFTWKNNDFEQTAQAYAQKIGGRNLRFAEGNLEFETAQGEQAFLERFGYIALLFIVRGHSDEFYRVLGSIKLDN